MVSAGLFFFFWILGACNIILPMVCRRPGGLEQDHHGGSSLLGQSSSEVQRSLPHKATLT